MRHTAQVWRKAAEIMHERGKEEGQMMDFDGRVCAVGAVAMAVGWKGRDEYAGRYDIWPLDIPEVLSTIRVAEPFIPLMPYENAPEDRLIVFSDTSSEEEVVALLSAIADALEEYLDEDERIANFA